MKTKLISLLLAFSFVSGLAACDVTDDNGSSDVGGSSSVVGGSDSETSSTQSSTEPSAPETVNYTVTEQEFATLVSATTFGNLTVTATYGETGEPTQTDIYGIDGNKIQLGEETDEDFTLCEIVGTNAYLYFLDETVWARMSMPLSEIEDLIEIFSVKDMLLDMDFADFTYADGYYTSTQSSYGNNFVITLRFEDGDFVSVCIEQTQGSEVVYTSLFTFSKIGTTTVTLPAEYVDFGEPSAWESYFVFENVTATCTTVQNFAGESDTYTVTETMKAADDKWHLVRNTDYDGRFPATSDVAYWDGTQIHVQSENTLDEDAIKNVGETWFVEVGLFAYIEDSFVETSEGVFEAEEIADYTSTYTDVRIVIVGGHIQSIEYISDWETDGGEAIHQVVTMTFTNWDTTVVPTL